MNLHEQTILIDQLIKEDSNATIKEYLEVYKEITGIEMFACEKMPDPQALKIIKNKIKK